MRNRWCGAAGSLHLRSEANHRRRRARALCWPLCQAGSGTAARSSPSLGLDALVSQGSRNSHLPGEPLTLWVPLSLPSPPHSGMPGLLAAAACETQSIGGRVDTQGPHLPASEGSRAPKLTGRSPPATTKEREGGR